MFCGGEKLLTGNTAGSLQLWSVDTTVSPPAVTMETAMEMDGGVFSAAFDAKAELVSMYMQYVCELCGYDISLLHFRV